MIAPDEIIELTRQLSVRQHAITAVVPILAVIAAAGIVRWLRMRAVRMESADEREEFKRAIERLEGK